MYGVRVSDSSVSRNVAIVNGTIRQAAGACDGQETPGRCSPVQVNGTIDEEVIIAGLDITTAGTSVSGIHVGGFLGNVKIYNNRIRDSSTPEDNVAYAAILHSSSTGRADIHDNEIIGARRYGIVASSGDIYRNRISTDGALRGRSVAIRLEAPKEVNVYENLIEARGNAPVGIALYGSVRGQIQSNKIVSEATLNGSQATSFQANFGSLSDLEVSCNWFETIAGTINDDARGDGVAVRPTNGVQLKNNFARAFDRSDDAEAVSFSTSSSVGFTGEAPIVEQNVFSSNQIHLRLTTFHPVDSTPDEQDYPSREGYIKVAENDFFREGADERYAMVVNGTDPNRGAPIILDSNELGAGVSLEHQTLNFCAGHVDIGFVDGGEQYWLTNNPDAPGYTGGELVEDCGDGLPDGRKVVE